MLVEIFNADAAKLALADPFTETRIVFSAKPADIVYRYTNSLVDLTIDGKTFKSAPFVQFGSIRVTSGALAERLDIFIDGNSIDTSNSIFDDVDDFFKTLFANPLVNRPVAVSLVVLNVDTMQPIGMFPIISGFGDNLFKEKDRDESSGEETSVATLSVVDHRAYASDLSPAAYSDVDHATRFADDADRALKHLADTVFREGKFDWNKDVASGGAGSSGGRSGGGGGFGSALRGAIQDVLVRR